MQVGVGVKFKRAPGDGSSWTEVYEQSIAYAKAADRLGFDYVVVPEHHSAEIGFNPTPFLTLTAIARETEHVRLTPQPLLLPLYHPVHVAEQLAALDLFSGGRAMLGVGVGYREEDFESFGVPRHERGARTEEALAILLGVLRERNFSYQGRFFSVQGVDITPRPLQEPHPEIFVTARSKPAVERAVRFGLGINTLYLDATAGGVYHTYCEAAAAGGVDPASLSFTIVRNGFVAESMDEAVRIGGPFVQARNEYMATYRGRNAPVAGQHEQQHESVDGTAVVTRGELLGTPDDWLAAFEADIEALRGPIPFTGYTLGIWPEGMAMADAMAALELYAREVLPTIQARTPEPRPAG